MGKLIIVFVGKLSTVFVGKLSTVFMGKLSTVFVGKLNTVVMAWQIEYRFCRKTDSSFCGQIEYRSDTWGKLSTIFVGKLKAIFVGKLSIAFVDKLSIVFGPQLNDNKRGLNLRRNLSFSKKLWPEG